MTRTLTRLEKTQDIWQATLRDAWLREHPGKTLNDYEIAGSCADTAEGERAKSNKRIVRMTSFTELETTIAGLFICLLSALDSDAADRALETLWTLVGDRRTGQYERKFYRDLFESVAPVQLPFGGLFEQLATTLH